MGKHPCPPFRRPFGRRFHRRPRRRAGDAGCPCASARVPARREVQRPPLLRIPRPCEGDRLRRDPYREASAEALGHPRLDAQPVSYGGAVSPTPLAGMPVGPWAMSAILAAAVSAPAAFGMVAQVLYLDDRSLRAQSLAELERGLEQWHSFEQATGMVENIAKRQLRGTTPGAEAEILRRWPGSACEIGVVLGAAVGRRRSLGPVTATEREREDKVAHHTTRASLVPSSQPVRRYCGRLLAVRCHRTGCRRPGWRDPSCPLCNHCPGSQRRHLQGQQGLAPGLWLGPRLGLGGARSASHDRRPRPLVEDPRRR